MNLSRLFLCGFLSAAGLGGCATNSGVFPVGPDTWTISTGADNFRGGLAGATRSAHQQASQYCASLGKEILVLRANDSKNYIGKPVATYDLTFRCLSSNDAELQRPTVTTEPDIIIENRN